MLNSTCMTEYKAIYKLFRQRLLNRGYPTSYLDETMNVVYDRNDLLFPPNVLAQYDQHYTATNPQSPSIDAFNPPVSLTDIMSNNCESVPIIFKLPFTSTISKSALSHILRYYSDSHSLQYEPRIHCVFEHRHHPLLCFTRTKSVGDILIHAQYDHQTCLMFGQQ